MEKRRRAQGAGFASRSLSEGLAQGAGKSRAQGTGGKAEEVRGET